MAASWQSMKHGDWKGLGPKIDKSIRARLARGVSISDVAEAVGVAEGYVRAIATEAVGDDAPPRDIPRPAPRPPEPGTALSRVHCLVAGEEIGARECISRQCSQKCFCPKASFAINAIAPTVLPGTRLEDELARCRAVARSVLLKGSVEERHLGPALVALRGGKPAPSPLIAGDLPAPPKVSERIRRDAAIVKKLFRPDESEPDTGPDPDHFEEPVKPAEEEVVAEKKECPLCGKTLRADNERGWCTSHLGGKGRLTLRAYAEAQERGIDVPDRVRPRVRGEDVERPAESKPHAAARPPRVAKPARAQPSPPPQRAGDPRGHRGHAAAAAGSLPGAGRAHRAGHRRTA